MIIIGTNNIAAAYVGATAVEKAYIGNNQIYPNTSLGLSASELQFAAAGQSLTLDIVVDENKPWTITAPDDWQVSPLSGTGPGTITVTAANNTSTNTRSGTLTLSSEQRTVSCALTQEAGAKVFSEVTISAFSYPDILAKGGSVAPKLNYTQAWTWNAVAGSGGNITSGATVVYAGNAVDTKGNVTALSKELVISDRSKVTTASVTVTLNGKSTTAQADIYQEANTRALTSVEIRQNGGGADLTTQFSAAGGSGYYAPYGTYTYTSGSTKWVELETQTSLSSWSVDQSWITLSAHPTYGWTVIAKAENRGTSAGSQRTATLKLSVGSLSDSVVLTQAANNVERVAITTGGGVDDPLQTQFSAAGDAYVAAAWAYYTSNAKQEIQDVTFDNWSINGSGFTMEEDPNYPYAVDIGAENRGTTVGPERSVTISFEYSGKADSITLTQEANEQKQTACSIEIDHDYQDPLGYNNTNVPAAGGRVCIVGVRHYAYTSGATNQNEYDSFTLNSNQSWCVSDDASNLTISTRGTVTGSDRSATVYWQDGSFKSNEMTITQKANQEESYSLYGGVESKTPAGDANDWISAAGGTFTFFTELHIRYSSTATGARLITQDTEYVMDSGGYATVSGNKATVPSRGTTIANERYCGFTQKYTIGGKTYTSWFNTAQNGNYVESIKGSVGTFSYPTIGAGAISATPNLSAGFGVLFTFSSGSTSSSAPASTYGTLSVPSSFKLSASQNGFTAVNADSGVLTATNRGTTPGDARTSGTVTRTLTATWTPTSSYNTAGTKTSTWSTTATCTQEANILTWNTPTISRATPVSIAANGGTNNVATGLTYSQTGQYSSGSPASANSGGTLSYAVKTAKTGFSLSGSTVTATNNTSTSARNGFVVRITLTLNGKTATKDITYNQTAGSKVYGTPSVSLSYPTVAYNVTVADPTVSYSQVWTWNGVSGSGGTITSGGYISYTGTGGTSYPTNTVSGRITWGTNSSTSARSITVTATVTLNGVKGTGSATAKQSGYTGPVDIYITTSFNYATSQIQINFSSAPKDTFFIKFMGYDQFGSLWEGVTGFTPSSETSFTYAPPGYSITNQFGIEGVGATEYTLSNMSPYETSNARYYWSSGMITMV